MDAHPASLRQSGPWCRGVDRSLVMVRDFINRYGEKGYMVVKAILRACGSSDGSMGDFSYKDVKRELELMGFNYNPSLILSKLEKEYGVIETTYKSSTQHWWRILDRGLLERIVKEFEAKNSVEDYELKLLRIQFYSLSPSEILSKLRAMAGSRRLSKRDKRFLLELSFKLLPLLVKFLEVAESEYGSELSREITVAKEIIELAEKIVVARGEMLKPPSTRGLYDETPYSGIEKPFKDPLDREL